MGWYGKGLALDLVWCYICLMSVTQTVDVPDSRRITIDVPGEVPTGRIVLTFTPISTGAKEMERELELINLNAERLNREALDVLSFQSLDL